MQSIQTSALSSSAEPIDSPIARAIIIGGAVVGVLDAADGVAYFGFVEGKNPIQVLQYIASGALGPSAFSGGLATAALGAVIHFALAYAFTSAFVLALSRLEAIRRHAVAVGLAWGAIVWAFMNLLVLPSSNVAPSPITALSAAHGIVGHSLFVGLAAAVVAKRVLGVSRALGTRVARETGRASGA
jgi:hypothetical protein